MAEARKLGLQCCRGRGTKAKMRYLHKKRQVLRTDEANHNCRHLFKSPPLNELVVLLQIAGIFRYEPIIACENQDQPTIDGHCHCLKWDRPGVPDIIKERLNKAK